MEKLLEIKKEPTDEPSTNLLIVDQQNKSVILNKSENVGNKKFATKQPDKKQDKLCGIRVDPKSVCRQCVKVFLTPKDLEIHRRRIHVKKVEKVSERNKELLNEQLIDNEDYSYISYYCNLCSFKSDVFSRCKDHMKSHSKRYQGNFSVITISKDASYMYQHRYKSFFCKLCKFKSYDQSKMIVHVSEPHLDIKHKQCKSCGVKFDNLATLDIHKCTHTSERPYKCTKQAGISNDLNSTDLSEVIKQEEYLIIDDTENEVKESPMLLGLLKQNIFKTEQIQNNFEEITDEAYYVYLNQTYRCTICPFGTKELPKIKRHFKEHNISKVSEAPYNVVGKEMCNKLKDYLYEYCDSFFQCKVCDFKSLGHESIKRHVDKFHLDVTSHCDVCYKFFTSTLILNIHHLDLGRIVITKQYKCLKCEYTSFEPLAKHMEIHPNKCPECDATSSKPLT